MSAQCGRLLGRAAALRWSAAEQRALRDAASSFSSLSPVLGSKAQPNGHSHSHSHGLFGGGGHGCGGAAEAAAKIDLLEHSRAGSRITLVGMGANVGMGVAKGVAGVYLHSSALLADAAHSLSDIVGDAVTLYTFRKSRKPADAARPFGYGRYEALGTLVVSAFLVAAGFGIGGHALEQAVHLMPSVLGSGAVAASAHEAVHGLAALLSLGHSHGAAGAAAVVDPRAIWFAAGSIVINEALFRATRRVGERTRSNVLIANAWHHRSDALTSLVSVGAIGGAIAGLPVLDALGGLLVSGMLARSGLSMAAAAARELTDAPPPPEVAADVDRALAAAVRHVPAVRAAAVVRCRKAGPFVHVHLRLTFAGAEPAEGVARAIDLVRAELRAQAGAVQDVNVEVVAEPLSSD